MLRCQRPSVAVRSMGGQPRAKAELEEASSVFLRREQQAASLTLSAGSSTDGPDMLVFLSGVWIL